MLKLCQNCGRGMLLYWGGRCDTCARYWRRHGAEHPLPIQINGQWAGQPCAGGCGLILGRELGQVRHMAHGCCAACAQRQRRRALGLPQQPYATVCQDCGLERRGQMRYARGRCKACYARWWQAQRGRRCADCGVPITSASARCRPCAQRHRHQRPPAICPRCHNLTRHAEAVCPAA